MINTSEAAARWQIYSDPIFSNDERLEMCESLFDRQESWIPDPDGTGVGYLWWQFTLLDGHIYISTLDDLEQNNYWYMDDMCSLLSLPGQSVWSPNVDNMIKMGLNIYQPVLSRIEVCTWRDVDGEVDVETGAVHIFTKSQNGVVWLPIYSETEFRSNKVKEVRVI